MNKYIVAGLGVGIFSGLFGFSAARAQLGKTTSEKWALSYYPVLQRGFDSEYKSGYKSQWSPEMQKEMNAFVAASKELGGSQDAIEQALLAYVSAPSVRDIKPSDQKSGNEIALIQVMQNQRLIAQNDEIIRLLKAQKK